MPGEKRKSGARPKTFIFNLPRPRSARFFDCAIDILLLAFAIAFVREIARSKSLTRFALWDAVSQSVDGIGEVYARLISGIDRPPAEVQDTFEIRIPRAWASQTGNRPPFGFLRFIYALDFRKKCDRL